MEFQELYVEVLDRVCVDRDQIFGLVSDAQKSIPGAAILFRRVQTKDVVFLTASAWARPDSA
jgi:hypothetical protein